MITYGAPGRRTLTVTHNYGDGAIDEEPTNKIDSKVVTISP